ncbi:hypothetical protein QUA56_22570 [Microcoleus sp. N3A4]
MKAKMGCPCSIDRHCPPEVSLGSDIPLAKPDRTCDRLKPSFDEKY